jgi:peroxiredoxin
MPQLKIGDNAPNFVLPAIDGTSFDMSNFRGKRIILTFFRFSSCPFCNIRINRILKRWEEFDNDTVMVGVFDAKIGELKKSMRRHNPPFTVVADETYENFLNNDVKKSLLRVLLAPMRAPLTMLEAIFRGYIPLTMSISKLSTIPVDVLIDENGKVVKAHYCKDTVDHLPIDELISFSKGE